MNILLALSIVLSVTAQVSTQDVLDDVKAEGLDEGPLPYPTLYAVPDTSFLCGFRWGFFADPETQCQVFHFCRGGRADSFLCPNGTLFHQNYRICDHWYNVPCP